MSIDNTTQPAKGTIKNIPYYNRRYGDWITPVVDRMLRDGRPTIFEVAKFGREVRTLEKMISRGINFMVDHCDTSDQKWKNFKYATWVRQKKDCAVLEFKLEGAGVLPRTADGSIDTSAADLQKIKEPPVGIASNNLVLASPEGDVGFTNINFQDKIEAFINSESLPSGELLTITGIILDAEAIMSVKASVAGLDDIVELVEIDNYKIVLRRV